MLRATFSQVMSLKIKMTEDKAAIKYIQRGKSKSVNAIYPGV